MARFSLAKATELDPGFMEAHNMQRARDRVPSARLAIAKMSVKRGDVERAPAAGPPHGLRCLWESVVQIVVSAAFSTVGPFLAADTEGRPGYRRKPLV